MKNIHASCISYKNKGILFVGTSGSGKSDMVLRMIVQKFATLVADDRVNVEIKNNYVVASCPDPIKGLLEVRHLGIQQFSYIDSTKIDVVIELASDLESLERLPEPDFYEIFSIKIPKYKLFPFEYSSLDKVDIVISLIS